ncbi:hypothetical protein D3Z52_18800 [Clostridiaceae bacterium]|nr:hypothetical protein [Clostridiaceae bacterium]NBI82773.1 hypothetical protein [Clostridiaceae bacterium]
MEAFGRRVFVRVGTAVVQGMKKTGGKRLLPARLFCFGDAVTAVSPVCAGGGRVLLCTCFYAGGGRALPCTRSCADSAKGTRPFGIPFTACGRGRRDAQPSFAEAIRYL